jgi:hypothetical protein
MGKHGNKHQVGKFTQPKNRKNLSQDLYAFSVNISVHLNILDKVVSS